VRQQLGLTLIRFNLGTVWWVEWGTNEKKYIAEKAATEAATEAVANADEGAAEASSINKQPDSPGN
jgi:hypothetical protein